MLKLCIVRREHPDTLHAGSLVQSCSLSLEGLFVVTPATKTVAATATADGTPCSGSAIYDGRRNCLPAEHEAPEVRCEVGT